jgi:hypothetical protein
VHYILCRTSGTIFCNDGTQPSAYVGPTVVPVSGVKVGAAKDKYLSIRPFF